jgi:uncharacterized protein (TIGR02145 family)
MMKKSIIITIAFVCLFLACKKDNTKPAEIVISEISVKNPPSTVTYYITETLDLSGLVIKITYSDHSTKDVAFADFASNGLNCSPENGTALTVSSTSIKITHTTTSKNTNQAISVLNEITDIDNNKYPIVKIGTQLWMASDLRVTKYQNGDAIGTTNPATLNTSSETSPKYQWAYNGNESNVKPYGRLYTWYAATDSRNICPTGWHIPSDNEWNTMLTAIGGSIFGFTLKEAGTSHWSIPNNNSDNSTGFTAIGSGGRRADGTFVALGTQVGWWTATEVTAYPANAYYYIIFNDNQYISQTTAPKNVAISIRCIRD